jgi:hypothetical protein
VVLGRAPSTGSGQARDRFLERLPGPRSKVSSGTGMESPGYAQLPPTAFQHWGQGTIASHYGHSWYNARHRCPVTDKRLPVSAVLGQRGVSPPVRTCHIL